MKKAFIIFALLAAVFAGCAKQETPINSEDVQWDYYNERASAFVTALGDGDFDAAADMFDATMSRSFGKAGLMEAWTLIAARAGAFISVHETVNETVDGYFICFITSRHENSGVTLRVVFDRDGLIAGLFTEGYPETEDDGEAGIVQREGYTDYPVVIGAEYPLDGVLSIPDNAESKVPAAVIVHGSGPGDMDGTIYSNKPYRDIAEFLASNGIAAIRYNKRTHTHGAKANGSWTVREETIEDAVLAAELLKADPRIDGNRVFIIGHSLGAMLTPRIHAEGGDFAGLILLAGSPRFLLDLSKDQNILYINATMEGDERETALAELEASWDAQVAALVSMPDDEAKNTPVEAGTSAYYYKDLYDNPTAAYIENINAPFLILQGSLDLQVSEDKDFAAYQGLLAGRQNVTFKLYEGLNHLFMRGSAETDITNLMDEYSVKSQVDDRVLTDITEWIKNN